MHKKTWQTVNLLAKQLDKVEERLLKVELQLKVTEEKQVETAQSVIKAEEKASVSCDTVRSSVVNEMRAQEQKKTNLVVYNLEESK